jgi:hypothetical protein
MRLSLLFGRFEYGKRGILDITHSRLFTFNTLRRAMRSAGFEIEHSEGIIPPIPFILGDSPLSRIALAVNHVLVRLWPKLFGFQILVVAKPRPTLASLLNAARTSASEKMSDAIAIHKERASNRRSVDHAELGGTSGTRLD